MTALLVVMTVVVLVGLAVIRFGTASGTSIVALGGLTVIGPFLPATLVPELYQEVPVGVWVGLFGGIVLVTFVVGLTRYNQIQDDEG